VFHGSLADRIALTKILLSPGGETLSRETAQFCAELLMDRDLNSAYHPTGVREFDRSSPEGLRKSLNHCHTVNHVLIRENDKLQQRLTRQWLWIRVLMAATSGAWALVVGLIVYIVSNW
jgi:hypothetical protein